MTADFILKRNDQSLPVQARAQVLAAPGFGKHFTDHMAIMTWTQRDGWHDAQVRPYGPLLLDPSAAVLHYAQEIFEGLKAYRHADDTVWAFRPQANAERFQRSARRLALPELPSEDFIASITALVQADVDWVPSGGEMSLYLRPFMFASEAFLGVRPATEVTYCVIASPAGAYFAGGVKPVSIWLSSDYTRASPGGTGAAKCGGNYAASLAAQVEATAHGCDQVCFLDSVERRWVEELGGMNLYFVLDDGAVVTPELTGTILAGVTRASIIDIAADLGHPVSERRVDIAEWREGAASGRIAEVFACGTAAVVTPVGRLASIDSDDQAGGTAGGPAARPAGGTRDITMGDGSTGPVTTAVRQALLDVQYGRVADPRGWMHRLA